MHFAQILFLKLKFALVRTEIILIFYLIYSKYCKCNKKDFAILQLNRKDFVFFFGSGVKKFRLSQIRSLKKKMSRE